VADCDEMMEQFSESEEATIQFGVHGINCSANQVITQSTGALLTSLGIVIGKSAFTTIYADSFVRKTS
jgi:hypothetical protein